MYLTFPFCSCLWRKWRQELNGGRWRCCVKARSPHVRLRYKHVSHAVLKRQFQTRVAALQEWKRTRRHRCWFVPCCCAFGRSERRVQSPEVCVPVALETQEETSGTSQEPVRCCLLWDDRGAGRGEKYRPCFLIKLLGCSGITKVSFKIILESHICYTQIQNKNSVRFNLTGFICILSTGSMLGKREKKGQYKR